MVDGVNNRYRQKVVDTSTALDTSNSGGSSSIKNLYNQALTDVAATNDEVNRSVGDDSSSSGSSDKNQKTAMWIGIGTALLSAAPAMLALAKSFGGKKDGDAAGAQLGGDPLTALQTATSNQQTSPSEANLNTLCSAINNARAARGQISTTITSKEAEIQTLTQKIADLEAGKHDEFNATISGLKDTIVDSQGKINESTKFIDENQGKIDSIKSGKQENGVAIDQNIANQAKSENQIQKFGENVNKAKSDESAVTETKITAENEQQYFIASYNELENVTIPGYEGEIANVDTKIGNKEDEIAAAQETVNGKQAQVDQNKKDKTKNSSDKDALREAKTALSKKKDELKDLKREKDFYNDKLEDAKNKKDDFAKKIKVGDTTLAKLEGQIAEAKETRATNQAIVDEKTTELKGYIDEEALLKDQQVTLEDSYTQSLSADQQANAQLAQYITNNKDSVNLELNVNEAKENFQHQIDALKTELGEKGNTDVSTLYGKLAAYDSALEVAGNVRDSKITEIPSNKDMADDITTKAAETGYKGATKGLKNIEKLEDNKYRITTEKGDQKLVDVNGNPITEEPKAFSVPFNANAFKPTDTNQPLFDENIPVTFDRSNIPQGYKSVTEVNGNLHFLMSDGSTKVFTKFGQENKQLSNMYSQVKIKI